MFQTEYEFTLPKGFIDENGDLHREGVMRLATAADEILPMKDPRVQSNPAYLSVIILSRVVTRLGRLPAVNTRVVENLFSSDLAYLQSLYNRINGTGGTAVRLACPKCEHEFEVEVDPQGGD